MATAARVTPLLGSRDITNRTLQQPGQTHSIPSGNTTVPGVSPPHTAPFFQRSPVGAPLQEGDMDGRMKDLMKQISEERVERTADIAK
mmetsp:Transcript_78244/g.151146  ORF Transcript_78244/g.151146 Transcript_78244/m.151146 type:complete len:88 (-) Transcript_78244:12-275(-)